MKSSRFSTEQIIGILKQAESGATVAHSCREHGLKLESVLRPQGQKGFVLLPKR